MDPSTWILVRIPEIGRVIISMLAGVSKSSPVVPLINKVVVLCIFLAVL